MSIERNNCIIMKIKILSDSTCDLTPQLLEKYNITLFPLTVIMDGKQYQDGINITPQAIFNHVSGGGELCSTAAVSVGEYADWFRTFSNDYDGIFHISLGSGFSSCYQNACIAASDFPNVRVIDSANLSSGQGLVVLEACRLAQEADDLDKMADALREFTTRVESSFLLDRLDYMVKGGRCSAATALGANLLNLKPCIEVRDGKMIVVKKYRGHYDKCLANYVRDRLANRDELLRDKLFVTYTEVTPACKTAVMDAVDTYGHFQEVYESVAGCTITCHCGPGTLGVLFVRK